MAKIYEFPIKASNEWTRMEKIIKGNLADVKMTADDENLIIERMHAFYKGVLKF
jgi:hypothetical protein